MIDFEEEDNNDNQSHPEDGIDSLVPALMLICVVLSILLGAIVFSLWR